MLDSAKKCTALAFEARSTFSYTQARHNNVVSTLIASFVASGRDQREEHTHLLEYFFLGLSARLHCQERLNQVHILKA